MTKKRRSNRNKKYAPLALKQGETKMRASRLLVQLTAYYLIIGLIVFIAVKIWPDLRGYLPIGGVEQLITQPAKNPLQASEAIRAEHVGTLGQSLFWLVVAIVGAFLA